MQGKASGGKIGNPTNILVAGYVGWHASASLARWPAAAVFPPAAGPDASQTTRPASGSPRRAPTARISKKRESCFRIGTLHAKPLECFLAQVWAKPKRPVTR